MIAKSHHLNKLPPIRKITVEKETGHDSYFVFKLILFQMYSGRNHNLAYKQEETSAP